MPFASLVTLSERNFGSIEKAYIYTTNDHAISYTRRSHQWERFGRYIAETAFQMQEDFYQIIGLLRSRILKPEIAAKFPLEKIAEAMELAESGQLLERLS